VPFIIVSIQPQILPILLAARTFPHVQAADEFRALSIMTRELFATLAGHKLFQRFQLHFGAAMCTFIRSPFNFTFAHFAGSIKSTNKNEMNEM